MTRTNSLGPRRRLLALMAALAIAATAAGSGAVQAVNGCKVSICATTTYYSDASHSHMVGSYSADGLGNCTGSGQITSFYTIRRHVCA